MSIIILLITTSGSGKVWGVDSFLPGSVLWNSDGVSFSLLLRFCFTITLLGTTLGLPRVWLDTFSYDNPRVSQSVRSEFISPRFTMKKRWCSCLPLFRYWLACSIYKIAQNHVRISQSVGCEFIPFRSSLRNCGSAVSVCLLLRAKHVLACLQCLLTFLRSTLRSAKVKLRHCAFHKLI